MRDGGSRSGATRRGRKGTGLTDEYRDSWPEFTQTPFRKAKGQVRPRNGRFREPSVVRIIRAGNRCKAMTGRGTVPRSHENTRARIAQEGLIHRCNPPDQHSPSTRHNSCQERGCGEKGGRGTRSEAGMELIHDATDAAPPSAHASHERPGQRHEQEHRDEQRDQPEDGLRGAANVGDPNDVDPGVDWVDSSVPS